LLIGFLAKGTRRKNYPLPFAFRLVPIKFL